MRRTALLLLLSLLAGTLATGRSAEPWDKKPARRDPGGRG